MFAPAYFDHNATTAVDARVFEAMLPYLREHCGNPSSRHEYGREARRAVDAAREQVAAAVGAHPTEVVFTSGGSEANNLFLRGAAACMKPAALAVSAVEHPSLLEPARLLARQGWRLNELAVDADGVVKAGALAEAMAAPGAPVRLASVMLANNETGAIQDVAALAEQAVAGRIWMHTDAVQALGKVKVDFRALGVQAMSLSAHKIHGPKGAGALVLDKRIELAPLILGGGQERGLRAGTENVAAIVGFGVACELAVAEMDARGVRLLELRRRVEAGVAALGATVFAQVMEKLPNTVFFAFPGLDGETLVGQLDRAGFALGSGSACSSSDPEPSHVLLAMGVAPELARGALRLSLGARNDAAQVADFLAALAQTVDKLRRLSAVAV